MNPPVPTAPKWVLLNDSSGQVQGRSVDSGARRPWASLLHLCEVVSSRDGSWAPLGPGQLCVLSCKTGKRHLLHRTQGLAQAQDGRRQACAQGPESCSRWGLTQSEAAAQQARICAGNHAPAVRGEAKAEALSPSCCLFIHLVFQAIAWLCFCKDFCPDI